MISTSIPILSLQQLSYELRPPSPPTNVLSSCSVIWSKPSFNTVPSHLVPSPWQPWAGHQSFSCPVPKNTFGVVKLGAWPGMEGLRWPALGGQGGGGQYSLVLVRSVGWSQAGWGSNPALGSSSLEE